MAITTLARRISKITFYALISLIVGRTLGNPEIWFDHELATQIGHMIYGAGEIGADNFYDLYFYISVITIFSITTVIYILVMKLLKKIRRK
ncbi:hypothetical protein BIY26_19315 [Brenneria goodwinii]|uniref:Uncharacterized protein n=1 Tax=Brenneria goodwinii TaxID=1109412 RepID=A0AAE8JLF1_9GAMM|nr:hypothetical protein AWC36_19185 [Brenneria goodwinii]RLM17691.1 hypothetical protein BIY28_20185 [Brenneria goodwinii]RLM18136.1 hypothetical protein BIY26_19315 [Brenneria goodwinii]